ncbi:MAG TPA: hypothetical protein VG796_16430 [Verrucomicrobiales bacterium]|nr:hypothetical protein [Verrucomicrobiales bacterium]
MGAPATGRGAVYGMPWMGEVSDDERGKTRQGAAWGDEEDAFLRFATAATKTPPDRGSEAGSWRMPAVSLIVMDGTGSGNLGFRDREGPFHSRWVNGADWESGIGAPNEPVAMGIMWNMPSLFLNSPVHRAAEVPGNLPASGDGGTTKVDMNFAADLMADEETTFYRAASAGTAGVDFGSHESPGESVEYPSLKLTVESILELAAVVLGIASLLLGGVFLMILHRRRHA